MAAFLVKRPLRDPFDPIALSFVRKELDDHFRVPVLEVPSGSTPTSEITSRSPLSSSVVLGRWGCGGTSTGSDQPTRQSNQAADLILCSDRNAQEIFDSGFLEMSYQNAELPKLGSEMYAATAAMARENEVRYGW